jgi:hypothetical protein
MVFSTGALYLSDNKQAGIVYFRELYLFLLILFVLFEFFRFRLWMNTYYEVSVLIYVLFATVFVAFLSYLKWGQPLLYGLLEERRVFHFLIFFPLFYRLVNGCVSLTQVSVLLIGGYLLAISVGWLYSLEIFFPRLSVDFQVGGTVHDEVAEIYEGFRSGRFRLAHDFSLFAIILVACKLRFALKQGAYVNYYSFLFAWVVSYIWFVDQTRSLMLIAVVSSMIILFTEVIRYWALMVVALVGLFIVWMLGFLDSEIEKFRALIEDVTQHVGPRTREITSDLIIQELRSNPLGNGSLSLQWNDGFRNVYNSNFYLSDVGLLGVVYRYGVFSLAVLPLVWYSMFRWMFKPIVWDHPLKVASASYLLVLSLIFPISNAIVLSGAAIGISFAVLSYSMLRIKYA